MGFIRVYAGGKLKQELELNAKRLTIGRTDDNDVALSETGVSRQHAIITKENDGFYIEDAKSRNGVFLNKKRIKRAKLSFWDEIQIQNYVIKFMAVPGMAAADNEIEAPSNDLSEDDKTQFVSLASERQLDKLRAKTRLAYLSYSDSNGVTARKNIKTTLLTFGKSKQADIFIGGWFAPAEAARLERQGSSYILIPGKRGKIIINGEKVTTATAIKDGMGFLIRNNEFKFFHRLTDS